MDPDIARDLVNRLTTRKFLLALLVIVLALVGYVTKQIDYGQLVNVALFAVGIFSGAEGLADAAGALRGRPPTPPTTTTVNVDTQPQPVADQLVRGIS